MFVPGRPFGRRGLMAALVTLALPFWVAASPTSYASSPPISTGDGSWVWQNPRPQGESIPTISCPTASVCYAGAGHTVLETSDGGADWTGTNPGLPVLPVTQEVSQPTLAGISCPSATTCYGVAADWLVVTKNGGANWTAQQHSPNLLQAISCPAVDVCYAGGRSEPSESTVVLKSLDGGATWTPSSFGTVGPITSVSCPGVAVCYAVDWNVVSSRAMPIVFKTADGGVTWVAENATGSAFPWAISCPSLSVCFTATDAGILKTSDGGQTWSNQGPKARAITCPTTASCYAFDNTTLQPTVVLATQDGGATWTTENPAVPDYQGQLLVASCPDAATCYIAGELGLIITTNSGGTSWSSVTQGSFSDLSGVSCPDRSRCVTVGSGGAILSTSDFGAHWTSQASGTATDLVSVSCAAPTTCVALGATLALTTTDGGSTWTSHPFAFGGPPHVNCPSVLNCYAVANVTVTPPSYRWGIYATKDGGVTWSNVFTTASGGPIFSPDISCPGPNTCYAGGEGLVRTTDGGLHWTEVFASDGPQYQPSCPTLTICYLIGGGYLERTTDGGTNWAFLPLPQFPNLKAMTPITPISISCPNATTCYLLATWFSETKILSAATSDGGATWTLRQATAALPNVVAGKSTVTTARIACPTFSSCIAVGATPAILSLAAPVFRPPDSGRPWTGGSIAAGAATASTDAYFAEGFTGKNFEEYLTVENPGPAQPLTVDYLLRDGTDLTRTYPLAATSRTTLNVNDEVGDGLEVSMHLRAANPIVAERPMYFDYGGITGGHDAVGAASPGTTFYFAEGYTGTGFSEFLTLMNPGATGATVNVTYYFAAGRAPKTVTHPVMAHSRATVFVNDPAEAGAGQTVSMKVSSDQPIVAERPMYFNYFGETGGSDVVGATTLLTDMNLAEGHVGQGFDEYLTFLNPNSQAATADVTYYRGSGAPATQQLLLPANSRTTVHVNYVLPSGTDSSVHVHSSLPILVERPMYFVYHGWSGGHDAIAVPDAAVTTTQYFAEGMVAPNFAEYYTIMNRNPQAANVTITYYDQNGTAHPKPIVIPAQSRWTEPVNSDLPAYTANSAVITSDVPILAERPMYFSY